MYALLIGQKKAGASWITPWTDADWLVDKKSEART